MQAPFCHWEKREVSSRFYGQEGNQKGLAVISKRIINQLTVTIEQQQACILLGILIYRKVVGTPRTLCNFVVTISAKWYDSMHLNPERDITQYF